MAPEPLPPLVAAVSHQVAALAKDLLQHGLQFHVAVLIDTDARTVVIEGDDLRRWGPRTMLEARLKHCGLEFDTHMPNPRIVIFPTS